MISIPVSQSECTGKVVFLGDSQLVRLQRNHKLPFATVNLAESGASVSRGLANLNKFLDGVQSKCELKQHVIVVLLGTNDAKRLTSAADFDRRSYKKITCLCRRFFGTTVLLKIPPIPRISSQEQIHSINRYINSFHSVSNIEVGDSFTPFVLDQTLNVKLRYFERRFANGRPDKVHLNRAGLCVVVELIYRLVNKLLGLL